MSIARPAAARSLVSRLAAAGVSRPPLSAPISRPPCHQHFHSSAQLCKRQRRRRFSNVHAEEMGLVSPQAVDKFATDKFPEYTAEELKELDAHYTPKQMEALRAAEAAIDPHDITLQGRLRTDIGRPQYIDDFSVIQSSGMDNLPRTTRPPKTTRTRFMNPAEFADDFFKWMASLPFGEELEEVEDQLREKASKGDNPLKTAEERKAAELAHDLTMGVVRAKLGEKKEKDGGPYLPTLLDITKYFQERPAIAGARYAGNSALAPDLGREIPGVTELYKKQGNDKDNQDPEGIYKALRKITGMTVREINDTPVKIVVNRRVVNQTRLGKIMSNDVIAIAGDGHGRIGIGIGRSVEGGTAAIKARLAAIQDMKPIVRYENRTIYGNIKTKISGTVVELFARPPGFGLRVPARIFEICRAAGITDLAARIPRSRNPMNTVKATVQALRNQPNPEDIAIGRGKKLVDVRKVYYGGAVY